MPDPLHKVSTRVTSQSEAADPRQVKNSAGGYTFTTGDEPRIHRFLTLGTTGGTYYTSERELTRENAAVVIAWATHQGRSLTDKIVEISQAGRAPRNNPALFALAAVAGLGDDEARQYALGSLSLVARTGFHLFTFAQYLEQFRGWGKGPRKAVSYWYLNRTPGDAAYQVLKYRARGAKTVNGRKIPGWSQRDMLRSAHPFAPDLHLNLNQDGQDSARRAHRELFNWVCGRESDLSELPLVRAFTEAQASTKTSDWVRLIGANRSLSWEMLPDAALKEVAVWEALITQGMPQTALMRQLPRLAQLGVLAPMSVTTKEVAAQLADPIRLRKARVHPVNILVALRTYASGHSVHRDARGRAVKYVTWTPASQVVDALDAAFYAAFGLVEPAGKRTMLALDVSGSMVSAVSGIDNLSCREASAALALVTAASEPETVIAGFTSGSGGRSWYQDSALTPLSISPRQRLDDAVRVVSNLPFGGTDCALPMTWALKNKLEVDTFQLYTDSETWAGSIHPHQALRQYRDKMGIPARFAVVGMTATDFTIADPEDSGSLDVAGFDSNVPAMLADFSRGDL